MLGLYYDQYETTGFKSHAVYDKTMLGAGDRGSGVDGVSGRGTFSGYIVKRQDCTIICGMREERHICEHFHGEPGMAGYCPDFSERCYRGVKEGFVGKEYLQRADDIRNALYRKITPQGLVTDAASSPFFDRPGTAVECQAHVLMMEHAFEDVRNS